MKDTTALDHALRGQAHLRPLSPREVEVMDYVVQGLSTKEIAASAGIAKNTVDKHLSVIRGKLQALRKNRNALIAAYLATRET